MGPERTPLRTRARAPIGRSLPSFPRALAHAPSPTVTEPISTAMPRRYRLHLAYDGTRFHGWQRQAPPSPVASSEASAASTEQNDHEGSGPIVLDPHPADRAEGDRPRIELRTVQAIVERAVFDVVREAVPVTGASRTDAGVHALAQTAAFTTSDERLGPPDEKLALTINNRLPHDVLCLACEPVDETFDPIADTVAKGYRYALWADPVRPLFDRSRVWHVRTPLDVAAMRVAAARLVGEHDFAAFAQINHGRESTVRTILACDVGQHAADPRRIDITVSGNGFLYNMVRIIAGTLVEVGRGRFAPDAIDSALKTGDRRDTGPTLGPQGLCLEWGRYPEPIGVVGGGPGGRAAPLP